VFFALSDVLAQLAQGSLEPARQCLVELASELPEQRILRSRDLHVDRGTRRDHQRCDIGGLAVAQNAGSSAQGKQLARHTSALSWAQRCLYARADHEPRRLRGHPENTVLGGTTDVQ